MITTGQIGREFQHYSSLPWQDYCQRAADEIKRLAREDAERRDETTLVALATK